MFNSRSPEAGISKFEINILLTSAHLYRDSLSNIQNEFNIGIIIIVCSTRHGNILVGHLNILCIGLEKNIFVENV